MPIYTSKNRWVLETKRTAYVMALNDSALLTHCYWGVRLPNEQDYPTPFNPTVWASPDGGHHFIPEEYPAYAGTKYIDPCLKATFADGVRDVVLAYKDFSISDSPQPILSLYLQDVYYPLKVILHYRVHEEYDLIERWVTLENMSSESILIERVFSAKFSFPTVRQYHFSHLYGRHNDEFNIQRETLTPGLKVIESRRIIPSHAANPWFAIDDNANETVGEVWFGTLAWSGNFKMTAEVTEFASTRLSIGVNDWDFAWELKPNQPFVTPAVISGYTQHGFGSASRALHDYVRNEILPHGKVPHKILYNSWEATLFNVDEKSQTKLAEIAKNIGVELFVMDDGWFHNRNWDDAGLGDWFPDKVKFPNGLGNLIKNVNQLGMDFGLWIEPEMVNPNSDLYRNHPDWVIHFPTRERTESRNQLILNMARDDVQEYLIQTIDTLLTENNIAFIKWDMNRGISEPGCAEATGDPREIWVRYVYGLYHVWNTLRQRHPHVIWQSCASGGGRADFGILQFADQIWVSDNTEATARLSIQEGFSQFLPANTMEAWVTDWGKDLVPLEFRFHVSMCGSLGVGGNLTEWNQAEIKLAAEQIQLYKEIKDIIQFGDQYRLISPQKNNYSAVQYVSKNKKESVLFVFRTYIPDPFNTPTIYLNGLEPESLYTVENFEQPRTGLAWMQTGIKVDLKNLQSKILKITRLKA